MAHAEGTTVLRDRWAEGSKGAAMFSQRTLTMSREELDARHLHKIQELVHYAYKHSDLHRRVYDDAGVKPSDIRTWDDYYRRLPFTDKHDYVRDQERYGIAAQAVDDDLLSSYFHTTGTTGTYLHEVYSEYDILKMGTIYGYAWWDNGIRPGDSIFVCHNFGFWLGLWHMFWGARFFGLTIYTGGGMTTDERLDAIVARRPTVLAGTPTYLLRLARRAQERNIDLVGGSVKFITAGGEPGLNIPVIRHALEDAWGAVGIDAYGLSEVGIAHLECGAHPGGVHVMEDAFHSFSVNSESMERVADGEIGENVVTAYSHLAQPFIKYRTHDLVRRYENHVHGCGWTWAYLDGSVLGRTDFMITIKGINVYPSAVENLVGEVPRLSHFYELHIDRHEGADRLLVKVEAEPLTPIGEHSVLAARLSDVLRSRIGVTIGVDVVAFESTQRYELKSRRIFDHRDPSERTRFSAASIASPPSPIETGDQ